MTTQIQFYCRRGHAFFGDNCYINVGSGSRVCRTCQRGRPRERRSLRTEVVSHAEKRCRVCQMMKSSSAFAAAPTNKDGLQSRCKACVAAASRNWWHSTGKYDQTVKQKRQAYRRLRNLRSKFGITPEIYDQMFEAQGGKCGICHQEEQAIDSRTGFRKRLAVDHDRTCCPGEVACGRCLRSLLCSACNQGIGQFREDPDVLRRAAAYIEEFRHVGAPA